MGIVLAGLIAGCTAVSYYSGVAAGQIRLLSARRDVEAVLADPDTAPETKAQLARVAGILAFSQERLQLEVGDRYATYVALPRSHLVWNVFAAPEFDTSGKRWCYPIVGCAVYRGYFHEQGAMDEARALERRGFDTYVGGVAAYSTLGWFDDPLVSTFIRWGDEQLAELLFHELAHSRVFIRDDAGFNEAFASFVGQRGVVEWFERREIDPSDYLVGERAQRKLFDYLVDWRGRLGDIYAMAIADDQKRRLKVASFEAMHGCYQQYRDQLGGGRFDRYMSRPFNNARLLTIGTYHRWVAAFEALFRQADGNWSVFYQLAGDLSELPFEVRQQRLEMLAEEQITHRPDDENADEIQC